MEFLKKNYEKILLGLVLLGLVVTVVFLLFLVAGETARLEQLRISIITRPVKELEPPVLAAQEAMLQRATVKAALDFSSTNKLFNPLRWQKPQNGPPFISESGPQMRFLQVTNVRPLYFTVSLDSVTVSESGARYGIGVNQQAGAKPKGKQTVYVSEGEKKEPVLLREARGPKDNPTGLVIELTDTTEPIIISKEKPYRRVDGYMVDMKYPPESRTFPNCRIDSRISFGGNYYKVVAITQDEVTLSAESNQKKWTIKFSAVP